jgi:osmotically-inducible protein OsmY
MTALSERIERELELVGVHAVVEERSGTIVLTGLLDTEASKVAAMDIVTALAPDVEVEDNLEVVGVMPAEVDELSISEVNVQGFPGATPATADKEALEPGDFTDQDILENPLNAAGPSGVAADEEISEGDTVYVPPTDPVRSRDNEVLGGFQLTSMDEEAPPRSESGGSPDEALAEAVLRELSEDASTTDLTIEVAVRNGVARLRGQVQDLMDAENAEAVAARTPGIIEVIEELEVSNLR